MDSPGAAACSGAAGRGLPTPPAAGAVPPAWIPLLTFLKFRRHRSSPDKQPPLLLLSVPFHYAQRAYSAGAPGSPLPPLHLQGPAGARTSASFSRVGAPPTVPSIAGAMLNHGLYRTRSRTCSSRNQLQELKLDGYQGRAVPLGGGRKTGAYIIASRVAAAIVMNAI